MSVMHVGVQNLRGGCFAKVFCHHFGSCVFSLMFYYLLSMFVIEWHHISKCDMTLCPVQRCSKPFQAQSKS